ncbi:DNA -binding domain-containing protein [Pelagibius sp.]|uniref:DNA -binding domain-containing protein n=1 Tax=Pelagibius sp. TaxID=1931238 RepID=UPI003B5020F8
MRKVGAFIAFVDPSENGLEANVFWRTETFARVLRAYVRPSGDPAFGSIISLGDLRCWRTLLKAVDGEQHLLLRDRRHVIQLLCRGADLRTDTFSIELVVDQFPEFGGRLRLLKAMADVYRQRRIGGGTGGWTVEAMRHRDALVTLDLRRQGWKFQDIARFIHGDKFVDEEWTNPNATLKNRTIRSFRRGMRMINGGYRKLLM